MKVVFADVQKKHDPKSFLSSGAAAANPEVPERAMRLLAAAKHSGLKLEKPDDYGLQFIAAVHSPEYLHYLQNIFVRWSRIDGAATEVTPNIHPDRRDGGYPKSAVGQAGWHHYDTSAPITADTWESALWSAHSATHAAMLVLEGAPKSYALCRPPGHHASREMAGGFCYLSNAAIAAEALLMQHSRVAILDIDVHHGNGTQGVFYARDDVLTVSLHADPVRFYPFFWGHRDERGEGAGLGYNLNVPLLRGTADDDYLAELERAMQRIAAYAPSALVVALGLDAHEDDPFHGLAISTAGFGKIAEMIGACSLPTVLVQEGGYLSEALGPNLSAFLDGFNAAHGR
jgi:acetoin utilization deacetylase AcuC-like enzyme